MDEVPPHEPEMTHESNASATRLQALLFVRALRSSILSSSGIGAKLGFSSPGGFWTDDRSTQHMHWAGATYCVRSRHVSQTSGCRAVFLLSERPNSKNPIAALLS